MKKFLRATTNKWGFQVGQLFEIVEEADDGCVRVRLPHPATKPSRRADSAFAKPGCVLSALFQPHGSLFERVEMPETIPPPAMGRMEECKCGFLPGRHCEYHGS